MNLGRLERIAIPATALSTLLIFVTALGEKLGGFGASAAFAYLYIAKDLFLPEIALVATLVLYWREISGVLSRAWEAYPLVWARSRLSRIALVLGAVVLGVLGVSAIREAGYYFLGKEIALQRHGLILADRAAQAYLEGNEQRARFIANTCIRALNSRYCADAITTFDRRRRWADVLRRVYTQTLPIGDTRSALALAIYMQDRNWDLYDEKLRYEEGRYAELESQYHQGVRLYVAGDSVGARKLLAKTAEVFDFAQVGRLMHEIEMVESGGSSGVLLQALQQRGVDTFVSQMTESYRPARLKSRLEHWETLYKRRHTWSGSRYVQSTKSDSEYDVLLRFLETH